MKKIQKIAILALVTLILIAAYMLHSLNKEGDSTESEAISLLKAAYPELKTTQMIIFPHNQSKQNRLPTVGTSLLFRKGREDLYLKQNAFS